jgi:hypothetical protein
MLPPAVCALDRHGDGVAVVFDQKQNRQAIQAGGIQRFPELAFAGGAIAAGGYQRDGVAIGREVAIRLGATDRLHKLRAGA